MMRLDESARLKLLLRRGSALVCCGAGREGLGRIGEAINKVGG